MTCATKFFTEADIDYEEKYSPVEDANTFRPVTLFISSWIRLQIEQHGLAVFDKYDSS